MKNKCPECCSTKLYPDLNGDIICNDCGLVIEEGVPCTELNYNEKSNRKVSSHLIDPIRERENRYQTKEDKKDIVKYDLKKTIKAYCEILNLSKLFRKKIELIIMKMKKEGHLSGVPYELTILSVILHLCLKEDYDKNQNWEDSLKFSEDEMRRSLSMVKQDLNYFQKFKQSLENLHENLSSSKIDGRSSSLSQKRIQDIFGILPDMKYKIISRLNNLYSNNIFPQNFPFLFSLEQVKYMDKRFLKAFENEGEFFNLLKYKEESDKKRILELRNNTPKYALRYIYAMKIPKERKQSKNSSNWKGLFCTCFYYLVKDYFGNEFKEHCPIQASFLKFFGIGKKNFIYYLEVFRRAHLDSKIFETKDDVFDLKGI